MQSLRKVLFIHFTITMFLLVQGNEPATFRSQTRFSNL